MCEKRIIGENPLALLAALPLTSQNGKTQRYRTNPTAMATPEPEADAAFEKAVAIASTVE